MNQKKENKELYEEIESEIVALPAWSAHECALLYLCDLCDKLLKAMKELSLDTSDLEKAKKEAEKAYAKDREEVSWNAYAVFDDAFFEAFEKASEIFGKEIGAVEEGDETADYGSEDESIDDDELVF